jgi:hypothetical protein
MNHFVSVNTTSIDQFMLYRADASMGSAKANAPAGYWKRVVRAYAPPASACQPVSLLQLVT